MAFTESTDPTSTVQPVRAVLPTGIGYEPPGALSKEPFMMMGVAWADELQKYTAPKRINRVVCPTNEFIVSSVFRFTEFRTGHVYLGGTHSPTQGECCA